LNQNCKWTGYDALTSSYVNVAPPAYGMNLNYPFVTEAERGKPVSPLRADLLSAKAM